MKILEYQGPWKMTIEEAPIPEPAPDEVLLKTIAVGICGSDVHGFTGESGRRKPGVVMGHEAVGEIVSLGSGITSLKIGQRVATIPWLSCGHCKTCMKGLEHICPDKKHIGVNAGRWGAMAEYYIANVRQAFPISDSIDPDLGLFAEPLGVATHALNLMNPAPGDVTAIVGSATADSRAFTSSTRSTRSWRRRKGSEPCRLTSTRKPPPMLSSARQETHACPVYLKQSEARPQCVPHTISATLAAGWSCWEIWQRNLLCRCKE